MKTIRLLGVWVCLLLGLAIANLALRTPPPLPANTPADQFSAGRAMADVRAIGRKPHPIGSNEIVRVRDHLLSRVNGLGLEVLVRPGEGVREAAKWSPRSVAVGAVQNIVATLPGADRDAPAVLVMSHYDTVHNSPGAADDSAGVAAALEIARALKAGPTPARDVIFLFTDGEEPGLLGAEAFFARDPLREHVGVVVNMEARGDAGRAAMFQTGSDSGDLVRLYAGAAHQPTANSLAAAVYARMPNDTDFTHALRKGLPGLNFAFIDDQLAYHTPLATPEHLNQGSLQNLGDQALPAVRALAMGAALPSKSPDLIYSDVLARVLVAYPVNIGWAILAAAGVLILFTGFRALRGKAVNFVEILRGIAGFLLLSAGAILALHLAGRLIGIVDQQRYYAMLGQFNLLLPGAGILLIGVCLTTLILQARGGGRIWISLVGLAAGGACSLVGGFDPIGLGLGVAVVVLAWLSLGKGVGVFGAWLGALLVVLGLAVTVQALLPGGSVMLAWPLLAASLAAALVMAVGGTRDRRVAWVLTLAVALIAIAVVAQLGAWGAWTFAGVGLQEPAVLAAFAILAAPALLPLAFDFAAYRWAPVFAGVAVAAGIGLLAYAGLGDGGPARPQLAEASHLADLSTGTAWRVSPQPRLDPWSRVVLSDNDAKPVRQAYPPLYREPVWMAPTAVLPVERPVLSIDRAGDRLLVRAVPTAGAEVLTLRLRPSIDLSQPRLNGRPIALPTQAGEWTSLSYHAPDPNGVTLSFTARPAGKVDVAVIEIRDGWPRGVSAIPAKPAGLMGSGYSDKTIVLDRGALSWPAYVEAAPE
ncbi:M20/M25/M40 family metallo-hydrolase [Caulobacter sp. Root1472]|uniref:M20/M25/M40 family metallo-hydrolase n=1 Tax=Caulobacter sp. Root1472 TaxID=1736470 RepID=UPI0006F9E3D7|nr:M20/M25/M40 family metallo-hydrolase [Caulobacter sp. Root1472]KQZ27128.1 peptidase M20 [Caulobacter sp. Root1472]